MKLLFLLIYCGQVYIAQSAITTTTQNNNGTNTTRPTPPSSTFRAPSNSEDDTTTVNVTTLVPTTAMPPVYTEFNFNKHFKVDTKSMSAAELEALTAAAFASINNRSKETGEEEGQVYDWWTQKWEDIHLNTIFAAEDIQSVGHKEDHAEKLKICYTMAVAAQNALTNLKQYYKIRYLYVDNLDYEIGYLVEEIIVHYQIAVELYHLMVRKYGFNRYRFYAPTTYMLYIYTNILFECKTILHLCNMLHELEKKYRVHPETVFMDYHVEKTLKPRKPQGAKINNYYLKIMADRKNRLKEQKKQRKKLFKAGLYVSTTRTRQPRKGPFELHYGWSIEYW